MYSGLAKFKNPLFLCRKSDRSLNVNQKYFQYTNINKYEGILFQYLQGICRIKKKKIKAIYDPF